MAKKKLKKLTHSPSYVNFINQRDKFLEELLKVYQARVGDEFRRMMVVTKELLMAYYPRTFTNNLIFSKGPTDEFGRRLDQMLHPIIFDLASIWSAMRRATYALSQAGEQQAINNAGIGKGDKNIDRHELTSHSISDSSLGDINQRTALAVSKLKYKIMHSFEQAIVLGDELDEALERVLASFPTSAKVIRFKPMKRMIKEADNKDLKMGFDFLDDDEWEEILDAYSAKFVPKWRDPRHGELKQNIVVGGEDDKIIKYGWELEKEITEDFVDSVRKGEHEAAKKQGITEFVWVAVIDDKTDECCVWRDGLTVTEIKERLDDGEDDDCDGFTPPIHMNCRCRLVPATENLPDKPDSNAAEFDDWLDS